MHADESVARESLALVLLDRGLVIHYDKLITMDLLHIPALTYLLHLPALAYLFHSILACHNHGGWLATHCRRSRQQLCRQVHLLRELHARAAKQGDGGVESGKATTALGSEAGS